MPGDHRTRHPEAVDGCWACKALSVMVAAAATPNRRPEPVRINAKDKALAGDLDAYQRLRRDGLQPKRIDGSADVEQRVNSQFDIDLGRYVPASERSRVDEAMAISKEAGLLTDGGR